MESSDHVGLGGSVFNDQVGLLVETELTYVSSQYISRYKTFVKIISGGFTQFKIDKEN